MALTHAEFYAHVGGKMHDLLAEKCLDIATVRRDVGADIFVNELGWVTPSELREIRRRWAERHIPAHTNGE